MTKRRVSSNETSYSTDELVEMVADSRILGADRNDDPQQLERVSQILEHLDAGLREDIVTRVASEDSLTRAKIKRCVSKHGLTPAEGRLVDSLCAGRSAADHAEQYSISPNTVRTHMQRVREKLGVKRQADIVRKALE